MSRSKNSRKGSKWGNYHCWCCKPKVVHQYTMKQSAKREGRVEDQDSRRDATHRGACWD